MNTTLRRNGQCKYLNIQGTNQLKDYYSNQKGQFKTDNRKNLYRLMYLQKKTKRERRYV